MSKFYDKKTQMINKMTLNGHQKVVIPEIISQRSNVDNSSIAFYKSKEPPYEYIPYMVNKSARTSFSLFETGEIGEWFRPVLSKRAPNSSSTIRIINMNNPVPPGYYKEADVLIENSIPFLKPYENWDSSGAGIAVAQLPASLARSGPAYNQAVYAMQSRLKAQAQTWVTIVEARKTISLVTDTATTIYTAFTLVKRGKFKLAAEILGLKATPKRLRNRSRAKLRSPLQNWLEYRYGWTPLYYDIYGHLVAFYERSQQHWYIDIYGFGFDTVANGAKTVSRYNGTRFDTAGMPGTYNSCSLARRFDMYYDYTYRKVKVGGIFEVKGLGVEFDVGHFDLLNAPSVVYELLPLSFVADWFVGIGVWLDQATVYNKFNYIGGYSHVRADKHYRLSEVPYNDEVVGTQMRATGGGNSSIGLVLRTIDRRKETIAPYADLVVKSINEVFEDDLGKKRMLDAIALLSTAFGGKFNLSTLRV